MRRASGLILSSLLGVLPALAQYTDPTAFQECGGAAEFAARREGLRKQVGTGLILLFARVTLPEAAHYVEDNDFFYYTGLKEPGAVLAMDAASGRTVLFQPPHSARELQVLGKTLLAQDAETRKGYGFPLVLPIEDLDTFLLRALPGPLWMRLGFPDKTDGARLETAMDQARHHNHPFGVREFPATAPIQRMREHYPGAELKDLTAFIDAQRNLKTPAEAQLLRRTGHLGAEGLKRAMAKAKPGMWQYQVEAEAAYVFAMGGAEGWAYPAIVGSGKDANTWHYFSNRARIEADELVVFDFSPQLHQMTMDITRTFNISGKFTPEQAKWYQVDLDAQKAVIALLKVGNTYEQAAEAGRKVFEKAGIGHQWMGFPGHFLGLATHDVGRCTGPIRKGQVMTVEPIIEFPEQHLHFRVEDTMLVTDGEPEILSAGVPKELAEVEKLVGSQK
ncbi:MAG TPA: Xaa-Pro peptidase family protein [Holophagaceae bacterium]|nr:Xaa-Pro peptidase family protein [Holophagaceae bacterium]